MPLSNDDVREILRIIDESDLSELRINTEGFSLHVVKGDRAGTEPLSAPPPRTPSAPAGEPEQRAAAPVGEPEPPAAAATDGLVIAAPMLGTFYQAEAPGRPPFVEVGERVEPDTIVCIIEVMKMMNSIPAGVSGTIAEVIAENAELVEYGQALFRLEPA